ncbi:hypothetical protein HYPSUDRAFT_344394 [Hypholoma sublateritium FD-334 SS-4]|uniref:Uncharacterized protein n=1 Tax=Hypholoma sublateritium (strain FD-334 SS-4) TaxID=945553 RepID=A0A0D2LEP9_HYPSF|nr:hypothetical protein HYPSUDRAFT_344394 [Hypholoma sublateritium FD-334 SS-4]
MSSQPQTASSMSDDEFDNIPDDFADVQDVDWAQILGEPSTAAHAANTPPTNTGQSVPAQTLSVSSNPAPVSNDSSSYFSDDDGGMDSGFFAELDRLEETLTHGQSVALSTTHGARPAQVSITSNAASSS